MNVSSLPRLCAAFAVLLALGAPLAPGARAQYPAAPTLTATYPFSALNGNGTNTDGYGPQSSLIAPGDGFLYGTTPNGGTNPDQTNGNGTVFKVHPDGSGFTVLHTFSALSVASPGTNADGASPAAALVAPGDGFLYGTAEFGGANGYGTVFKISTDGATYSDLHDFGAMDVNSNFTDGANPAAALISIGGGFLAGTASTGGVNGFGSVFKVSTDGVTYNDLHDFSGTDGASPTAALLAPGDGFLYGTTSIGGTNSNGTLFRWGNPNVLTTLYSFTTTDPTTGANADGANPQAPLIALGDGFFYGTAAGGGTNANGTVFRFSTDGTAANTVLTTLHSFSAAAGNTDGSAPRAALVAGGDGLLYGTASASGANGSGTVFRLSPDGTTTPLQAYYTLTTTNDGSTPEASLLVLGDGFLYGTTIGGGANGSGTVFRLTGPPVTHVLWTNPNGRTIFWNVNADGSHVIAGNYPAFNDDASGSTTYKAIALSTGPDGVSHVLWTNPDGHVYLWTVQADGSVTPFFYGPFSDDGTANTTWQPVAVSTGGDNVTHVLWSNPNGRTILWNVASDGTFSVVGNYDPQFDGAGGSLFVPISVASAPSGLSHILWNNSDNRTMLWNLDATGAGSSTSIVYKVFEDDETPNTIWKARSLSVGPDTVTHILWNNPNGHTILWNVGTGSNFSVPGNYGAYQDDSNPRTAYTAVSLATGLDNLSHFAWDSPAGNTYLWSVSSADGSFTPFFYSLATDDGTGSTIWHAVAVSASTAPAPVAVP